jgi:tetratricopeptide (TPR) repeat protein
MNFRFASVTDALPRQRLQQRADGAAGAGALKLVARFWFAVTVAGQLMFAAYMVLVFGLSAVHGHLGDRSRFINHGYIAGDSLGNLAAAAHILFAIAINLSGALQLVPRIRDRWPVFHRWNGRLFIFGAFVVSLAGLYMTWFRHAVGDLSVHLASTLDVVLIDLFAALALRNALARDFAAHRRWALRLFMVLSGVWFFRLGLFLWLIVMHGPAGFDAISFTGPFLTIWSFGEYLLPLAVLEVYLRAQDGAGGARGRFGAALLVFVMTLAMLAGLFATAAGAWIPAVKTAYENRDSIVDPLYATIQSRGVDAAVRQYRTFKQQKPDAYDFEETELNDLGYKLIHDRRYADAARIFALNVEAYPKSGNAYDSLGEAYMDEGDKAGAIANYRKSLQLDPSNKNAVARLQKLNSR